LVLDNRLVHNEHYARERERNGVFATIQKGRSRPLR
jgi:hypothetical protein